MAFKSFKYKFCSKGYHSAAQKSGASFFDSSYHYLKQNQGLINLDTILSHLHVDHLIAHPVVVANSSYNNMDYVLQDEFLSIKEDPDNTHFRVKETQINKCQHVCSKLHETSYLQKHPDSLLQKRLHLNEKRQKKFYSTSVIPPINSNKAENSSDNPQNTHLQVNSNASGWEPDTELCLNKNTFLQTQVKQINQLMLKKNYNMVNSLYQSLRRNDILPPVDIFEKTIESIIKRDLDNDNLDEKIFQLLNCYQDLVSNKMKPTNEIYSMVIGYLLQGSIRAFQLQNTNGYNFFKIAIDLFFASNLKQNRIFNQETLDYLLLSINFYPNHMEYGFAKSYIDTCSNYTKTEFFYISMISYARVTKNGAAVKDLYEEFRLSCKTNKNLHEHQYEVYSIALSGLVETGNFKLALKLLNKLLIEVKTNNGLAKNTSLILSNFLISLSKSDPEKSYKLWHEFSKLNWIPEFSYEFYLVLLANSLNDWTLAKKIYNYIFPMKRSFRSKKRLLKDYLLYPIGVEHVLSSLLNYSFTLQDNEIIMKLLEESVVKSFKFEMGVYPSIFRYFKQVNCPEDYQFRFIEHHGSLMKSNQNKFDFLKSLTDAYASSVFLKQVTKMNFFLDYCKSFNINDHVSVNYSGLVLCFEALWNCPQELDEYDHNLELHSMIISRIYDLDCYYTDIHDDLLANFKIKITENFQKLIADYKEFHLDVHTVSNVVSQAVKMVEIPEDVKQYFLHPGDWDKSYPLNLSRLIRSSPSRGISEFKTLLADGYCFDYNTYEELIHCKFIDRDVITQALNLCPDSNVLKYICNNIIQNSSGTNLEELVLDHPLFSSAILPNLHDSSLSTLASSCHDISKFNKKIGFPERFKGISIQAEFKNTIRYVYKRLFASKNYQLIIEFNKLAPALDISLVLKSCVRAGDYKTYRNFYKKFKKTLGNEAAIIHAEYLVNHHKIEEAMQLLKSQPSTVPHKTNDLYSFVLFLKSFQEDIQCLNKIENTLQLANSLSSQKSYGGMVSLYRNIFDKGCFSSDIYFDKAVKFEILGQVLNNLEDALHFTETNSLIIQKTFLQKVKNYFRFKSYLEFNYLTHGELQQLLNIWCKVSPKLVDVLFNNIVESIHINKYANYLFLEEGLIYEFTPPKLLQIVDFISAFYNLIKNQENSIKAERFKGILKATYNL